MLINQKNLDSIYCEIKSIFEAELAKLPTLKTGNKKVNRGRIKKQPFWNAELEGLWTDRCMKERVFSKFKCRKPSDKYHKNVLKVEYRESQKLFDKTFRQYKRQHKASKLHELENLASSNSAEMWKKINALSEPKSSKVVMEIIREDGTISGDVKDVLT